jgi:hypothetical protein
VPSLPDGKNGGFGREVNEGSLPCQTPGEVERTYKIESDEAKEGAHGKWQKMERYPVSSLLRMQLAVTNFQECI